MKGLSITAKDLAKIGQLILQHGKWNGEQLIDSTWIRRSVSPQLENPPTIGLLWMVLRKDEDNIGYWHSGSLGQYLVIYPEEQLVGVRQIVPFPSYNMETDGFRAFMSMVRKLGN